MASVNRYMYFGWNYLSYDIMVQVYSYLSEPKDRCRASLTCKRWRKAYLEPTLWQDCQLIYASDGWRSAQSFIQSLGRSARGVTIYPVHEKEFKDLLNIALEGKKGKPVWESEESFSKRLFFIKLKKCCDAYKSAIESVPVLLSTIATCSNRLTTFRMKLPLVEDIWRLYEYCYYFFPGFFPTDVMQRIWIGICEILRASTNLQHLELGYHFDIFGDEVKLELLRDTSCKTLKTLRCTSVLLYHDDMQFFSPYQEPVAHIEYVKEFTSLTHLTINLRYVTDQLLEVISSRSHCQMSTLTILHCYKECPLNEGKWTSDEMWKRLMQHSPNVEICMSYTIPDRSYDYDPQEHVLKPGIPIQSLIMTSKNGCIHKACAYHIAEHFKDTLLRLEFHSVGDPDLFKALMFRYRKRLPDCRLLLMLLRTCTKLKFLSITGFRIYHEDVIRLAKLRPDIDVLDVGNSSPVYENGYNDELSPPDYKARIRKIDGDQLERCVSHVLGRPWKLLAVNKVHYNYPALLDDELFPRNVKPTSQHIWRTEGDKTADELTLGIGLPENETVICYKDIPRSRIAQFLNAYRALLTLHTR